MESKIRYRVNISTSVKGVHTFEATAESDGLTREALVGEVKALAVDAHHVVQELNRQYPPTGKEEK